MHVQEELTGTGTPEGVPRLFTIEVRESGPGRRLTVRTPEDEASFDLADHTHDAYLDFYVDLSRRFGTRLPENRKGAAPRFTFTAGYRPLLTENLHPGIRYGYGDPAVLRVPENGAYVYYLVVTSNDAPDAFPLLRSEDLEHWNFAGFVFPQGTTPAWAATGPDVSDYWAPEIHYIGGEYRMYFVARHHETHELCIGMARAGHPAGPYVSDPEPLLRRHVIDPHVWAGPDGTSYLFWKEDNNDLWPALLIEGLRRYPGWMSRLFPDPADQRTAAFVTALWPWAKEQEPMERFQAVQPLIEAVVACYTTCYRVLKTLAMEIPEAGSLLQDLLRYMRTPMYAQPLSPDGSTLTGERVKVLENDLDWEAHLVEGMWVTQWERQYYLFYAGNDFSTDQYGIGIARARHPLGPYRKLERPFLSSTAEWTAPGHPSVAPGPDGQPLLFLHAYRPGEAGYKKFRALLCIPLQFGELGFTIDD